jgi:hypothetical protein
VALARSVWGAGGRAVRSGMVDEVGLSSVRTGRVGRSRVGRGGCVWMKPYPPVRVNS